LDLPCAPISILNVLLRPDKLLVAVDTLAHDAQTGQHSQGAKLLLIPQYNLVLACRGSAQFFLRIYELCLQASFRADFTMEQLMAELGLVSTRFGRPTWRPPIGQESREATCTQRSSWGAGPRRTAG